jgi:hypothetical protein
MYLSLDQDLIDRNIRSLHNSTRLGSTVDQNDGSPNSRKTFAANVGSFGEYPRTVKLTPRAPTPTSYPNNDDFYFKKNATRVSQNLIT